MSDLVWRLETFGSLTMDEEGRLGEFEPNPLTFAAAQEIRRLQEQVARLEAVGETLLASLATARAAKRQNTGVFLSKIAELKADLVWFQDAAGDLRDAFQRLTDQGDDCPLCWAVFKDSGEAVDCFGHAVVADLEARRG